VPLPPFNPKGVLPPGIHLATEAEVQATFVDAFAASKTRLDIFNGLTRWRRELSGLGIEGLQWIDGSFVTDKVDPDDVDVITFCDYDTFAASLAGRESVLGFMLNSREATKPAYRVHTFLSLACVRGHGGFSLFESDRTDFLRIFSFVTKVEKGVKVRDMAKEPKGWLSMSLGASTLAISSTP
jgi:hypothetical protein